MSKPDWDDSPEWAEWLAKDEDGQWGWFQNKPELGAWCWIWGRGNWAEAGSDEPRNKWDATLEKRP